LYRGTTVGWPGNPVLQRLRYTTTTVDPVVATLFALEAANYGEAVVLLCQREVVGAMLEPGNVLADLEGEVVVSVTPAEFYQFVFASIGARQSRDFLSELGVELPAVIGGKRSLTAMLREHPRLTDEQIAAFDRLVLGEGT
jgi:hypothetical protein